jgi:predicted nucleotidyltransferase
MTNEEMRSFGWYKGGVLWLKDRTIFLTRHGSHAYGTNVEGSDEDFKGLAIAPREYYLGNLHKFEQAENKGGLDVVIYDIKKFVQLATECNPNVIEVLNTKQEDWSIPSGAEYEWAEEAFMELFRNRDLFLSKLAKFRFSGYAFSQLKRIKTHRRWLLDPPKRQPVRVDYDLPESNTLDKQQLDVINSKIEKLEDKLGGEGFTKDRVEQVDPELVAKALQQCKLDANLMEIIVNERRYHAAMKNWHQYLTWKEERNPKRSALEASFGYDTKHAMHLVRLMRMAREILDTGQVIVRRPDAEELVGIRNGAWSYEALMDWALKEEEALNVSYASSLLPHSPDRVKIDRILVDIIDNSPRGV